MQLKLKLFYFVQIIRNYTVMLGLKKLSTLQFLHFRGFIVFGTKQSVHIIIDGCFSGMFVKRGSTVVGIVLCEGL